MSLDPAELLLEDHGEEPGVELSDFRGSHGDVHGLLATAQHHVVVDGRDGGRVDGPLRFVGVDPLEALKVVQVRRVVLRRRDEHRAYEMNEKKHCLSCTHMIPNNFLRKFIISNFGPQKRLFVSKSTMCYLCFP